MTTGFADLLERLGRPTPADAALGLERLERGNGKWSVRMPCDGAALDRGCVAHGALIVLADIGLATGVQAFEFERQPEHLPMATLNLRLDCWAPPPSGQGALVHSADVEIHNGIAFASGHLVSDDGTAFGNAVAHFHLGAFPGGRSSVSAENAQTPRVPSQSVDFASFLNLVQVEADGSIERAFGPAVGHIGSTALPAYHGGVIAAAMQAASEDVLGWGNSPDRRSSAFEYLRPAIAKAPVQVKAEVIRAGRSTAVVHATAWQEDPLRPVALGAMLFRPASC